MPQKFHLHDGFFGGGRLDGKVLFTHNGQRLFGLVGGGFLSGGCGQLVAQAFAVLDHAAHQKIYGITQGVLHAFGGFFGAHGQRAAAQRQLNGLTALFHRYCDLCLRFFGKELIEFGQFLLCQFDEARFQRYATAGTCDFHRTTSLFGSAMRRNPVLAAARRLPLPNGGYRIYIIATFLQKVK